MISKLGAPGDTLVKAASSSSLLSAGRERPVGLQGHLVRERRQPLHLLVQRRLLRDRLNPM
ncbi:hypothetical protein ABZ865_08270 [Streptomyces sp. NPDC047085]|uniref:hypothetical protein n=1 Tax=Streptomyces sp. NPDC047085 TaxID=3155140 RepID=UPI0033D5A6BA